MSFKSYQDKTIIIHGKSVPKKNEIGTPQKKPDLTQIIHASKIDNGEIGLTRITREFAQTLINGRKKFDTEEKSFTQKDLANKSGVSLQIIQGYEKIDTIIDNQFQTNCNKIKKALNLSILPKLITPKLKPEE
jgi:hypothetical protein